LAIINCLLLIENSCHSEGAQRLKNPLAAHIFVGIRAIRVEQTMK